MFKTLNTLSAEKHKESNYNVLHLSHTNILTDSRILKEIQSLARCGYQVSALGVLERSAVHKIHKENNIEIENIKLFFRGVTALPKPLRFILLYFELICKVFLKSLFIRPNVIHCHDAPLLPIAGLASFLFGARLIYDAHELESKKNGQGFLLSFIILMIEKFCWFKIDALVSVSPSIIKWYNQKFHPKKSVLILNSPSFKENNAPLDSNYLRKKFDIQEVEVLIVYVGLFLPGRGIESILSSFRSDDLNCHIVFLGDGPLFPAIRGASAESTKIHVHSPVHHNDVVHVIKSADYGVCFIEPVSLSDYYCLPNKLFEYAFAHIPVLASNFPDMRNIITKHKLGLCIDHQSGELSKTLRNLSRKSDYFSGADLESLSWETQGAKLEELYADLL